MCWCTYSGGRVIACVQSDDLSPDIFPKTRETGPNGISKGLGSGYRLITVPSVGPFLEINKQHGQRDWLHILKYVGTDSPCSVRIEQEVQPEVN